MKDFAAIDFETANNERSSVCSVVIFVIVRNGEIVDSFFTLSSSRSLNTIIIGVLRCMDCVARTQRMLQFSLNFGRSI